jgi:poly-beta-1,6-N-acetyl-D-glucosamine biosynthesis protein PgaD
MDKSRSRISQDLNRHHTTSLKHPLREAIMILLSLVLWVYVLVALMILLTSIFGFKLLVPTWFQTYLVFDQSDVLFWAFRLVALAGLIFVLFFLWSFYNLKRYGAYHRRVYPQPSDDLDILALHRIDPSMMSALKSERHLIFSHNPVHAKKTKA